MVTAHALSGHNVLCTISTARRNRPAIERDMLPISIPYVYNLGTELQRLRHIAAETALKDSMWILMNVERELNEFLNGSVYTHTLKASVAPGKALLDAIKRLTTKPDKDQNLDFYDTYSLTNTLQSFETVFTAEMNVGAAYLVTKKRGYDTGDLIWRAYCFPLSCPSECLSVSVILEKPESA
jgi:hypothetical protein